MSDCIIKTFDQTPQMRRRMITATLQMLPDHPVDAVRYAKLILAQVKLLRTLSKEDPEEKKDPIEWVLVEAASIGDRACFTLMGLTRSEIANHIEDRRKAKEGEVPADVPKVVMEMGPMEVADHLATQPGAHVTDVAQVLKEKKKA